MSFSDILMSPASFAPLIVGSLFFAIGMNSVLHFYKLKRIATRIRGRVIAIEKYTSEYRGTSGTTTRQVYFRPIVEYVYNGETRMTKGASVNEIRHKLKQNIFVLLNVSDDGDQVQATVEDSLNTLLGIIFACVGLGGLGAYIFAVGGSWIIAVVTAAILTGIGHVLSNMILTFKTGLISVKDDTEIAEDSTLIETKADYIKEVSAHAFWGWIIALAFMMGSIWIMYAGYTDLPSKTLALISDDFDTFWQQMMDGELSHSAEKPLMIFGTGAFFFLASLRSVYCMKKKYGAMLKL